MHTDIHTYLHLCVYPTKIGDLPLIFPVPQEAAAFCGAPQGSPLRPGWLAGAQLALGLLVAQLVVRVLGRRNAATPRDPRAWAEEAKAR